MVSFDLSNVRSHNTVGELAVVCAFGSFCRIISGLEKKVKYVVILF